MEHKAPTKSEHREWLNSTTTGFMLRKLRDELSKKLMNLPHETSDETNHFILCGEARELQSVLQILTELEDFDV